MDKILTDLLGCWWVERFNIWVQGDLILVIGRLLLCLGNIL